MSLHGVHPFMPTSLCASMGTQRSLEMADEISLEYSQANQSFVYRQTTCCKAGLSPILGKLQN